MVSITRTRTRTRIRIPFLLHSLFCALLFSAIGASAYSPDSRVAQQPLLEDVDILELSTTGDPQKPPKPNKPQAFHDFLNALDVLQSDFFAVWEGLYPTGIDWTAAVMSTHVAASLSTLSTSYSSLPSALYAENLINKYFSQLIGYHFGQDAFALRQEAYDDMLWVVLGWLEAVKFVNLHSNLHFEGMEWYGTQYIPAFAHRARVFWDLASQGWNTTLCGGGMIWSPYLTPYKNAITNELFISASISMYLYFPGENNTSPFSLPNGTVVVYPARDPKYLQAAIEGYRWLHRSNMTDSQGLYVDGYHISDLVYANGTVNTRCDQRNEMVYTYNQGVLLSGQRGLYEATGARSYLEDGHRLIKDVIAATGYNLSSQQAIEPFNATNQTLGTWYGLGRHGVMEDACDFDGSCSQDGQTFKGILFNHLTLFCRNLPLQFLVPVPGEDEMASFEMTMMKSDKEDREWHAGHCTKYVKWIRGNADAALGTRNEEGVFGMWWDAPVSNSTTSQLPVFYPGPEELKSGAVDYRNLGVPETREWRGRGRKLKLEWEEVVGEGREKRSLVGMGSGQSRKEGGRGEMHTMDLNDRGRTLETQGGGVGLLRALWEIGYEK